METPDSDSEPRYRIVVVDDHALTRLGVAHVVRSRPDWELCGEAGECVQAIQLVRDVRPDLAIVDLRLPGGDSMKLIEQIRRDVPSCRVLALSAQDEELFAQRVLRAGGQGFISKMEPLPALVEAIEKVLAGRIALSPRMTDRLLAASSGHDFENRSPLECLSNREMEVFDRLGRGSAPKEIARDLHLSIKTVEYHRQNIVQKLQLSGSKDLLRHATLHVTGQLNGQAPAMT
ncbi:response regulator transcription factor [Planctomyces sp. SH-PL14]|uniref:response regulator transcription factor n=1 Tax=Planctomyces sp. SH-PL14 TaxID=1632864 RepID=UPI00078E752F|nr:response regulator transcription factor [Planctomyces sp. SH-PL14]AMV19575.1 Oxygen regulatory protein NreC [Planctomyces sp. SH-PL14]